jgi:chromate transporter
MLHLIEYELVEKEKLLDYDSFHDGLALSQTSPGPIAVNISVFLGYRLGGYLTAIICALATILPAFLIISFLTGFILEYGDNPYMERFFKGIRPAVGAMITFSLVNLLKKNKKNYLSIATMIISFGLLTFASLSPIIIIISLIIISIISRLVKNHGLS